MHFANPWKRKSIAKTPPLVTGAKPNGKYQMKPYRLAAMLGVLFQLPVFSASNATDPAELAYNLKTAVEAYEKVGRKDPIWNADAEKCLTTFAQFRALTNGTYDKLLSDLHTNLVHLAAVKCDDPLIRYLYVRFVFSEDHSTADTASKFADTAEAMQKSEYPDIRKFYAATWASKELITGGPTPPMASEGLRYAAKYLAKALEDKSIPLREVDQACDLLMSAPWWAEPTRWDCYCILESALTNRWNDSAPALLAKGRAYLAYAWQARGTGYANTVSDQDRALFAQRLDIADAALEAAWDKSPDARVCLEMLCVEQGQGKGRERLEMWFQRGMKLNPADHDLCLEKLEYLRPRWYGSIDQMIEFGRECTTNTNWSGTVRLMLADAHHEAAREIQDRDERAAYWKQTNVWPDLQFTFEQYLKLYPDQFGIRYNYASDAIRCGQWQAFLDQTKLFRMTNYEYFGGRQNFDEMVRAATQAAKKP
jgi:hypothetical protein